MASKMMWVEVCVLAHDRLDIAFDRQVASRVDFSPFADDAVVDTRWLRQLAPGPTRAHGERETGERKVMERFVRHAMLVVCVAALAAAAGCDAPAVGDPCEPEQIPAGGFDGNEAYLETSSVQCRTRVCMVYKLDGTPRAGCNPAVDPTCITDQGLIENKVYCTCRCDTPEGVSGRTCNCPSGFVCCNVLDLGGEGIRGSYCVREDDADRVDCEDQT